MEIFVESLFNRMYFRKQQFLKLFSAFKTVDTGKEMLCHPFPPILAWPVPVTGDELHGGRPCAVHAFGVQLIRSCVPSFRIATTLLSTFLSNVLFKPIIVVPHFQISPSQQDFNHHLIQNSHNNEVRNLFQLCIYDDTTSSASDCK